MCVWGGRREGKGGREWGLGVDFPKVYTMNISAKRGAKSLRRIHRDFSEDPWNMNGIDVNMLFVKTDNWEKHVRRDVC